MPESILEQERQAFISQASQELFAKFERKPEKAQSSKNFLTTKIKNSITEEKFNDAINFDNSTKLQEIFAEISQQELLTIAFLNKLQFPVNTGLAISGEDNEIATKNLKQLVGANENSNQKYEGICVVKTTSDERNIDSEPQSTPFAMHSIGKVFTGVLIAEMVANKTISPDDLEKVGVELDEEVMKALPASVQAQLQKVSLHQLMTHQAALGDYLSNYMDKIEQAVAQGAPISQLENPQDFLQYASDEIKENKYSNLGMLLAGLAAQHLYNKKHQTEKSYNEILQELVIEPAHLESFSITPPKNALFNDESAAQKYICGSPAGGYWASAEDMQKFGEHLCNRMEDEKFHAAVLQYGQEFYNKEDQTIQHAGDIGYEGSAWFSVHLPSRTSLVMASNDVYSRVAGEQANRVIAAEQRHKNPVTKEELDTFFSLSEGGINTVGLVEYSCKLDEEAQIKTSGSRNFYEPSQPITAQTIVGIGSITKQFTAATLIKLWDDELTAQKLAGSVSKFFTNGLDTKLENFIPSLRNQYPQCSTLFDKIEQDENYHKITLRDLLNHTHGLGARNNKKAEDLVRQANGAPLELSSIANITEKREGEEYGKHCYGNFGYDLAAMIIETVAKEKSVANSFDDAVTKLVLQPNQLNATHTQQDHAGLYANEDSNIATGFAVDNQNPQQEFKMNGTSNTRAAGGFKSSVENLAKFAPLFMNAEMFANEEVRQAVLDRKQGAPLSNSATELTYHLAIRTNPDGTIGHNGNDLIFNSKLSYNPQTKAVKAELQVMETLVDNITKEIFTKIYQKEAKKLENDASGNRQFWEDCKFLKYYEAAGYPPAGSPEAEAAEAAALKASPKTRELFAKYNAVRKKVASLPRQSLIDDRAGVVEKTIAANLKESSQKTNELTTTTEKPSSSPNSTRTEKLVTPPSKQETL